MKRYASLNDFVRFSLANIEQQSFMREKENSFFEYVLDSTDSEFFVKSFRLELTGSSEGFNNLWI